MLTHEVLLWMLDVARQKITTARRNSMNSEKHARYWLSVNEKTGKHPEELLDILDDTSDMISEISSNHPDYYVLQVRKCGPGHFVDYDDALYPTEHFGDPDIKLIAKSRKR